MKVSMKFYRYCARCGTEYSSEVQKQIQVKPSKIKCEECGLVIYNNPKSATGAFIVCDGKYLMTRRAFEPEKGKLDVPGGFVDYGETGEEAIARELEEELGLAPDEYDVIGIAPTMHNFYVNHGYPDQEYSVMTVFYILTTSRTEFAVNDDVAGYEWVSLGEIPADVGFPELREYLTQNLDKIKKTVE
jgi:NAD+ diphosphatase